MNQTDPMYVALQQQVTEMALIDRNHYLNGVSRRENDIEHSFSVALLAWYIYTKIDAPQLDVAKILQYSLAHDFVERYAGDTNAFATKEERASKVDREREALERLSTEFRGFPTMVQAMHAYEDKSDDEALFVWTVDKMQALILGNMDNWRPYKELKITYESFSEKYLEHLGRCSPYVKDIFAELIAYEQAAYYDQPVR